jgi:hypothetical protein
VEPLPSIAMTVYDGTTEVQLNLIAERLLGLPRDTDRPPNKSGLKFMAKAVFTASPG